MTASNPGEGLISPSQDGVPVRGGKEQTEPVDFSQAPGFSPRGFEACFPRGSTVPGDGLSRYRPQNGKIFKQTNFLISYVKFVPKMRKYTDI